MSINKILLIPFPEHQSALLTLGLCGARPPTAQFLGGGVGWTDAPSDGKRWPVQQGPALALAWQGKVVPEGCDRAARGLAAVEWSKAGRAKAVGVTWRPSTVSDRYNLFGWSLEDVSIDENTYYAASWPNGKPVDYMHLIPVLEPEPEGVGSLLPAWALAVVCEARGLGIVIIY